MPNADEAFPLEGGLDERYLIDTLVELAKVPTEVPLGTETFMEPDDPKLVHYVQQVLRPKIQSLAVYGIQDVPSNQLVMRLGEGSSDACMLVMAYTPTQHHNLMEDPFSGKIGLGTEWGYDEPCVFGQGMTQNKAHHAVMLAVLKLLTEHQAQLRGTVYFAINNEGLSSHRCTEEILKALDRKPDFGLLLLGTGLRVSLGNRGRVDINVEVRGKAVHSSAPSQGLSAIAGANEVMNRLKLVPLEGTHPILGGRHAIPYQLTFEPMAPHTLPEIARMKVDRRLLPGDDVDQAVEDVRKTIGDLSPYQVSVEKGEYMLPALVDAEHRGVQALMEAHRQVRGSEPETFHGIGTFDAGGQCSAGVPAVMYGAGGGGSFIGVDFAPVSQVIDEARVVTRTILSLVG
ncbi:MAG: M20/M25/M40 family metallo-hydrolase [Dehalococcoidia bacterium]|nr:M20/M25/M40 family metallo-hydrolase [Dehalococcoidia bacterium]MDP7084231.1 M20/M25/M40 family metallo-hydrolase [Dehalococcoidia bacterium]MDP7202091.1 M20/M25/M40 family metallo-hydrolase [Dehalococcoidia bacterium]HJN87225.1 M20/M25/M40 family metallo-hydrolase [Dehalococcoidia bacterium]